MKGRMKDETVRVAIAEFGLPLHLYLPEMVAEAAEEFRTVATENYPATEVVFAVKSNPCMGAIRTVQKLGHGVDVVSEFELKAAQAANVPPAKIVCNGNAKTDTYLKEAVECGATIAADSLEEVKLISQYAELAGNQVPVLIRLSGMALDGLTSADQSTAASWTKFGIPVGTWHEFINLASILPNITPVGISAHIGTQVCDEHGYERLITSLLDVIESAADEGWRIKKVDIGGGYPLSYLSEEDWEDFQEKLQRQREGAPRSEWVTWGEFGMGGGGKNWSGKAYWSRYPGAKMVEHLLRVRPEGGQTVAERLKKAGEPTLIVEPGRGLFGRAGITLAEVMGVKEVEGNSVVVLDLGIVNHGTVLVTPDIYPMEVFPALPEDRPVEAFVAGRLCFTGDMISKVKVKLNRMPKRGDILKIGMTGAYSADHFASNSCGFPRPAKVAVMEDGTFEIWREAEKFEEIFS